MKKIDSETKTECDAKMEGCFSIKWKVAAEVAKAVGTLFRHFWPSMP